jgi:hypothetical protein
LPPNQKSKQQSEYAVDEDPARSHGMAILEVSHQVNYPLKHKQNCQRKVKVAADQSPLHEPASATTSSLAFANEVGTIYGSVGFTAGSETMHSVPSVICNEKRAFRKVSGKGDLAHVVLPGSTSEWPIIAN